MPPPPKASATASGAAQSAKRQSGVAAPSTSSDAPVANGATELEGAPAMANTTIGPEMPLPAAEEPTEVVPDVGSTFSTAPEPESHHHDDSIPLPLKGAMLRCDNFSELGEGVAVRGEVTEIDERHGHVLLFIESAQRRWPIGAARIRGNTWMHDAGDYPAPGANPTFDARFRQRVTGPDALPPPVVPAPRFSPPRPARGGHAWVEFADDGIDAVGFDLQGEPKKRFWKKGERGEVLIAAVTGSPQCFIRL